MFASYGRLIGANRNFRRIWIAQIVSELGDWFFTIALYTLLLEFTGKATSVGIALVLQVLPQTLIGPAAGVINDRISRKRIMIATDVARAVIVSGMLLVRTPGTVWLIYPLLVLETFMAAFFEPARSASLPNIVSEDELLQANTLSNTTWSANMAIGTILGGLAAALLGRDAVFTVNALSFLASAWLIRGMRFNEPHAAGAELLRTRDLVDFSPVMEGARYIGRDPRLLATVLLKCGMGMLGASWIVFPIYAERIFPQRFPRLDVRRSAMLVMSLLMAARGVGALIGPFLSVAWAGDRESRMRTTALAGFLAGAAGYLALSYAPTIPIAFACIALAHAGGAVIWVTSSTLLQIHSDDRFRGRVFAADLGFCMLSIAVTAFAASQAVDAGVPVRTVAFCTGLGMLIPGFLWLFALRLWRKASGAVPAIEGGTL